MSKKDESFREPITSLVGYIRDRSSNDPASVAASGSFRKPSADHLTTEQLKTKFWQPGLACPAPAVREVNPMTGEVIAESPCGKIAFCHVCVIAKARKEAGAVMESKPSVKLAWTFPHWTVDEAERAIWEWRQRCRIQIPDFAITFAFELNPLGRFPHAHGFGHAGTGNPSIDCSVLEAAASELGFGRCDFGPVQPDGRIGYYGYPMKTLASESLRQSFLDLNRGPAGQRLMISLGRFYRIGRNGTPCGRDKVMSHRSRKFRAAKHRSRRRLAA